MRPNDLSGAHEWIGAVEAIRSRMVCRLSGRKTSEDWRLVKMRVLEGGTGWISGGRLDKSRLSVDFREETVEARDGGEGRISGRGSILGGSVSRESTSPETVTMMVSREDSRDYGQGGRWQSTGWLREGDKVVWELLFVLPSSFGQTERGEMQK